MTNVADVLEVGEKHFEDELHQGAKLVFMSNEHLEPGQVDHKPHLPWENQPAIEVPREAGNTQVWK